jgi:predicted nucleic-acid-binding Zn-ribbon protein
MVTARGAATEQKKCPQCAATNLEVYSVGMTTGGFTSPTLSWKCNSCYAVHTRPYDYQEIHVHSQLGLANVNDQVALTTHNAGQWTHHPAIRHAVESMLSQSSYEYRLQDLESKAAVVKDANASLRDELGLSDWVRVDD